MFLINVIMENECNNNEKYEPKQTLRQFHLLQYMSQMNIGRSPFNIYIYIYISAYWTEQYLNIMVFSLIPQYR